MYLGLKCVASRALYEKSNHLMEKLSRIVYFIAVGGVLGVVIPKAIVCFFKYYTTNLGRDAFDLPLPTWCVCKFRCTFGLLSMLTIILYSFNLKVSVWLEKPHWLFDCHHPATGYSFIYNVLLGIVFISCIRSFYIWNFGGQRFKRHSKFNQWTSKKQT